jgi:hypothetical protein
MSVPNGAPWPALPTAIHLIDFYIFASQLFFVFDWATRPCRLDFLLIFTVLRPKNFLFTGARVVTVLQ